VRSAEGDREDEAAMNTEMAFRETA
jgi:hypothetical protein